MSVDQRAAGRGLPGPPDRFDDEAIALIRQRSQLVPLVAVVLGSGLGDAVAADLQADHGFAFESIAGFPRASVPGHAGRLVLGYLLGVPAAVFLGRVHLYEGHGIGSTTLIPRLAAALGAQAIVLTNAAGRLDERLHPGQLMLITDHLNFMGANPLAGWRYPDGVPAFVGLAEVYDLRLRDLAIRAAAEAGVDLGSGVYAGLPGPSYETPAETRFLASAGAQAVGMSTVPEAVAARALGLAVLAISCITNVAGSADTHQDVLAAAARAAADLRAVLAGVLPRVEGALSGREERTWTVT